jgi:hypothetical protein
MAFSDRSWQARFGEMGDAAEKKYVEFVQGKCVRFGLDRPEGVNVPSMPTRVRARPDFHTNDRFVECMGLGRAQHLQLKLEKLNVLWWWNNLMPVDIFVWDSHKKRSCLIPLTEVDKLIQTPGLVKIAYFDDSKLVFRIPAAEIFSQEWFD